MADCTTLLDDFFNWAVQQDLNNGKCLVDCTVASNQADNIVSYATGQLEFSPSEAVVDVVRKPAQFSGELVQLFSNRIDEHGNPFDPEQSETIHLTINGDTGPVEHPSPATLSVTLLNWGNVEFNFALQCMAGVIYGSGNPIGTNAPDALYVVSIANRRYLPNDNG